MPARGSPWSTNIPERKSGVEAGNGCEPVGSRMPAGPCWVGSWRVRGTAAGRSGHRAIHRSCRWLPQGLLAADVGSRGSGVRVSHPAAASPSGLLPANRWPPKTGLTVGPAGAVAARCEHCRSRQPCHPLPNAAVTSGNQRTVTVSSRRALGRHPPARSRRADTQLTDGLLFVSILT
jgi:hypothetical protein